MDDTPNFVRYVYKLRDDRVVNLHRLRKLLERNALPRDVQQEIEGDVSVRLIENDTGFGTKPYYPDIPALNDKNMDVPTNTGWNQCSPAALIRRAYAEISWQSSSPDSEVKAVQRLSRLLAYLYEVHSIHPRVFEDERGVEVAIERGFVEGEVGNVPSSSS